MKLLGNPLVATYLAAVLTWLAISLGLVGAMVAGFLMTRPVFLIVAFGALFLIIVLSVKSVQWLNALAGQTR